MGKKKGKGWPGCVLILQFPHGRESLRTETCRQPLEASVLRYWLSLGETEPGQLERETGKGSLGF